MALEAQPEDARVRRVHEPQPHALATGAGAEARQPIGWVIVGGLMLGTLFTLYVVPTAYVLLARRASPEKEISHEPVPGSAD